MEAKTILGLVVALLLVGQIASGQAPVVDASRVPKPQRSFWQTDLDRAWELASSKKKPVFLIVTSEGCPYCRQMESVTLRDARVVAALSRSYIPTSLNKTEHPEVVRRLGIQIYPTAVVIGLEGRVAETIRGYVSADDLRKRLDRIQRHVAATAETTRR